MIFSKILQYIADLRLKLERLNIVDEKKLLGLIITSDLKWNKNTEKIVKDANMKMITFIRIILEVDWNINALFGIAACPKLIKVTLKEFKILQ